MSSILHLFLATDFMRNALLAGILAAIGCGIIGPFVVVRRVSYIAGGIAHTVLAGLGIAYFFAQDPMLGALIAAVIAALIIGIVSLKAKKNQEIIVSVLWAAGMAVGLIFISKTPGYNANLLSYLFGNILLVSSHDILLLLILDVIIVVVITLLYQRLLAITFDEEFARIRGLKVAFYYLLLLCLVAFVVVSLVEVVGLILVLALLTIPAAVARQYVSSLLQMIYIAIILGILFVSLGLGFSYHYNLPSGAVIILVAVFGFVCSGTVKLLRQKWLQ